MRRLLLSLAMLAAPFCAHADDAANLRREIEAGPHRKFVIEEDEIRVLLAPPVEGEAPRYIFRQNPDGQTVSVKRFLGIDQSTSESMALFETVGEISTAEFADRKARGDFHGLRASPAGSGVPGLSTTGETQGPRGDGASQAESGNGTGTGSLGQSLKGAAKAGVSAAVVTGVVRGIIMTPKDQRELARMQKQIDTTAARMQADLNAFLADLANYDQKLVEMTNGFGDLAARYRPLAAPRDAVSLPTPFSNSDIGRTAQRARAKLEGFSPRNPTESGLKDFGLAAADASAESFAEGSLQASREYADLAELTAGVALGLNPVTALVQDGFELFTGRNFVTGREISDLERSLAGAGFIAGLATGGLGSSLVNATEMTTKLMARQGPAVAGVIGQVGSLAGHLRGLGVQTAQGWSDFVRFSRQTLGNEIGAVGNVSKLMRDSHLGAWVKKYDLRRIRTADDLNAAILAKNPLYKAPYKPGTQTFDLITREKELYLRLHNTKNQEGRWLIRGEAVDRSLSPADLRLKYSLPETPEFVSVAELAPGTLVRRSKANSAFGGGEGAIQYEVLDSVGATVKFGPPAKLPGGN